jgi:FAD synthetase
MIKAAAASDNGRKRPVKVMVFGTFDQLHQGHEFFLREAKKHGDSLVVVVARDRTVMDVKGRPPSEDEKRRKLVIERTGIADKVVLGSLDDKYEAIRKERPDVICLGYDQSTFIDGIEAAVKSAGIKTEVLRLGSHKPHSYKTSLLKKGE